MKIFCIDNRGFSSNTYILENCGESFIFDPSVGEDEIYRAVEQSGSTPIGIVLTHGHFDHILTLTEVREKYKIPVYIHALDAELLTDGDKNAGRFFFDRDFVFAEADKSFQNGDELMLGGAAVKVLHTPGHTKGSSCFHADNIMISGDTIFAHGYGRYDLYGGDGDLLFKTLAGFKKLDGATKIYPGHGESASLERALKNIGI